MSDGTRVPSLGRRGEGWVVLQGLDWVLAALAAALGPRWPNGARTVLVVIGALVAVPGAALVVSGFTGLGSSVTPFPRPHKDATFRTGGGYRLVRHPMYGGLLLVFVGGALMTSPVALFPAFALALIFEAKRRIEEGWLLERYPEYAGYRRQVRHALVPGVW